MTVQIIVKPRKDLTPEEVRSCRSLSFRNRGRLCDWLNMSKHQPAAKVVLAKDGEKLVGWGMTLNDHSPRPASGYYVRRTERRKGIGGMIYQAARKEEPNLQVFPHDKKSNAFFRKYGAI
jgi:L-amino acid N-acyltransferase YncA